MEVFSKIFSYTYLMGSLVLMIPWLLFYCLRQDLRKKILFSSVLAALLGATEVIFVPKYWTPRFPCIRLFRDDLYLESFLFSFFLGGIAAVFYQVFFRTPLFDTHRMNRKVIYLMPLFFFSFIFFPNVNVMYFCLGSFFITSFLLGWGEPRLILPMLANGFLLLAFAALSFFAIWNFYSDTLPASFNYVNLSGIRVFGMVPIEELLFYLGMGTFWSVFYELVGDSRYRKPFGWFYEKEGASL